MGVSAALFFVFAAVLFWAAAKRHWFVAVIAFVLLLGMFSENQAAHVDKAAQYREAQDAVARATGKPCDYACKEAIADQARP